MVKVLFTVKVFPSTRVNVAPVAGVVRVRLFTDVGVIAPRVRVIAGVVVAVSTLPETPLAVVTETLVTVPLPPPPLGTARTPSSRMNLVPSGVPDAIRAIGTVPVVMLLPFSEVNAEPLPSVASSVFVPAGNVTFVVAVAVNVRAYAPAVIRDPPLTSVSVAAVAGCVIATLLIVPEAVKLPAKSMDAFDSPFNLVSSNKPV
jgi:hypothetical protein